MASVWLKGWPGVSREERTGLGFCAGLEGAGRHRSRRGARVTCRVDQGRCRAVFYARPMLLLQWVATNKAGHLLRRPGRCVGAKSALTVVFCAVYIILDSRRDGGCRGGEIEWVLPCTALKPVDMVCSVLPAWMRKALQVRGGPSRQWLLRGFSGLTRDDCYKSVEDEFRSASALARHQIGPTVRLLGVNGPGVR